MAVSSLVCDETVEAETENFTDDIMIISDRLNGHKFQKASFLGRQSLHNNPLTNAYREINGAADGLPGWIVDQYGSLYNTMIWNLEVPCRQFMMEIQRVYISY